MFPFASARFGVLQHDTGAGNGLQAQATRQALPRAKDVDLVREQQFGAPMIEILSPQALDREQDGHGLRRLSTGRRVGTARQGVPCQALRPGRLDRSAGGPLRWH